MDNNTNENLSLFDVVFAIEASSTNGSYINELKTNYILPTLEYLSQGIFDENEYFAYDRGLAQYGIVLYHTASILLNPPCKTFGPFTSAHKVYECIDRLSLQGGGLECSANMAEAFASVLCCFEELHDYRLNRPNMYYKYDCSVPIQKLCILICNSPPYTNIVTECKKFLGKTGNLCNDFGIINISFL